MRPGRRAFGAPGNGVQPALLFQVAGQQLSVQATRRTLDRIQELFGGHLPSPAELLRVDPGELRRAGLSHRKIGTLRDLAQRVSDGQLDLDVLSRLPRSLATSYLFSAAFDRRDG